MFSIRFGNLKGIGFKSPTVFLDETKFDQIDYCVMMVMVRAFRTRLLSCSVTMHHLTLFSKLLQKRLR